jgi:hypothetical protein
VDRLEDFGFQVLSPEMGQGEVGGDAVEPGGGFFDFLQGFAFEPKAQKGFLDDLARDGIGLYDIEDKGMQNGAEAVEDFAEGGFIAVGNQSEEFGVGMGRIGWKDSKTKLAKKEFD